MLKKILLIIIVIFCTIEAQIITFDKTYPGQEGYFILPTSDNSFIAFSKLNDSVSVVIKVDQFGWIRWQKTYTDLVFGKHNNVAVEYDNSYFIVGNSSSSLPSNVNLKRIDVNGNLIWEKEIGDNDYDNSQPSISITDQGNILVASASGFSIKLTELTPAGNIVDIKNILPFLANTSPRLIKLEDGNFLVSRKPVSNKTDLVKINSEGDSLWVISFIGYSVVFKASMPDGSILASVGLKLYKIDLEGNIIWDTIIPTVGVAFAPASDGNYLVLIDIDQSYNDKIIKLDKDGNIIMEKPINGYGNFLTNAYDGGLITCGKTKRPSVLPSYSRIGNTMRILKMDQDADYKAINLYSPEDNSVIYSISKIIISWNPENVDFVDISYSKNSSSTWETIAQNYPADYDSLTWYVPLFISDALQIKIVDSNDPETYDRTDPGITAIIYQQYDTISVNDITMWIGNNGMGSSNPLSGNSGFYWPNNEYPRIASVFADGLVWGGKINGEIRVNGNTFRYGLKGGRILPDGTPAEEISIESKIYKLRKNWEQLPDGPEKQRLQYDLYNWPVDIGAPWNDVNEDGVYTPGIDTPKLIGDETLFYVANDLDTVRSRFTYGSDPIGLEFQTTVFGFNREDLKDVVFKKYKVINKSNSTIEDMYFTYWTDPDLGNAGDDYEGFDTTLNMGYVFNGDNDDNGFYGTPPPAVGYLIVQGPLVKSTPEDSALYNNEWISGYKNLGLTASGMNLKNMTAWPGDPDLGVYAGTLQFYFMMQGLNWDGSQLIDPITGEPTIWALSGDPVTGTGWYEGGGWPGGPGAGDRRIHVPSGPFSIAPGDTQEVVIAIMMAKGTDNINSITELRELATHIQEFYNTELVEILNTKETIAPTGYTLYQNYPNPFNPVTTIEYEIPEKTLVTIKLYDILGREVKTLIDNEEKVRYKYSVDFDGSSLTSGVYFYRMQAGSFTETKKMILLK